MVYIYKKVSGEKSYYYLRASMKKKGKVVTKDLAYLGNSIENVQKKLDSLAQYKSEIKKAYRTIKIFLETDYYLKKAKKLKLKKDDFLLSKLEEVEACKIHYSKKFKRLDKLTQQDFMKAFAVEFAFNTTSIEGNTITLKEARNLLEEGYTPKNKTLREIHDVQNTSNVFLEILKSKKEITHEFIIDIHKKLMENVDKRIGYRTGDIRVTHSQFDASPAKYIKTDINLLLKWYNKNKNKFHPLVLSTLFHHKFERVHPFWDGNGRTGRMLMNYILIRNNYPPIIIKKKLRLFYLNALRKADKSELFNIDTKKYLDLVEFASDSMISKYWNIFLI
ncbi:Fic family protein [Nanoarchaeota archaeon]